MPLFLILLPLLVLPPPPRPPRACSAPPAASGEPRGCGVFCRAEAPPGLPPANVEAARAAPLLEAPEVVDEPLLPPAPPARPRPRADRARQLAPLGERYLVRMREVELTTASGLVLPGAAEKAAAGLGYAEVLAVGDDVKAKDVKVGDSVMFSQYSATDFQHEGEDLAFVREGEILGVLS